MSRTSARNKNTKQFNIFCFVYTGKNVRRVLIINHNILAQNVVAIQQKFTDIPARHFYPSTQFFTLVKYRFTK